MQNDMSGAARAIVEYLGCPCEVFAPRKNEAEIFEAYHKAFEEGQSQGFTPLLIVPDDTLVEYMGEYLDEDDYDLAPALKMSFRRENYFEEMENFDPNTFFAQAVFCKAEPGPIEGDNILNNFTSHWDYDNNQTYEIILAKIPTTKPWELAIWLPMGGFNDCPLPDEQAALMKRWSEKYGARPVLVTCDAWEFSVPAPLADKAEALKLAYEHYAFCPDRVENYGRDEYSPGNLADSLMKSKIWYFSWL